MNCYDIQAAEGLRLALIEELEGKEAPLSLRATSMLGGHRQMVIRSERRYFSAVLANHIMDNTQSVVLLMEVSEDAYILRMCCPISDDAHARLSELHYVPPLRSRVYLTVGLGEQPHHVWAAARLTPHSSVIDLYDGLHVLKRELERYLKYDCEVL